MTRTLTETQSGPVNLVAPFAQAVPAAAAAAAARLVAVSGFDLHLQLHLLKDLYAIE